MLSVAGTLPGADAGARKCAREYVKENGEYPDTEV